MVDAVTYVSAFFAALMVVYMTWLIYRRWRSERTAARKNAITTSISRYYLGRVSGKPSSPPIQSDKSWNPGLRLQAISHLAQLLRGPERERLLDIVDEEQVLAIWMHRTRSRRPEKRMEAIRVLEQLGSPRSVSELIALMANEKVAAIQLEAAGALARLNRLPSVRDTISLLSLNPSSVSLLHNAIFRSLAQRDDEEIQILLGESLSPRIRVLLIDALGWSQDLGVLSVLATASGDASPEVRKASLSAVRQLAHAGKGEWVLALLNDADPTVRAQAALTCGSLRLARALDGLRTLEKDPSLWVRMRAHDALEILLPPGAASELAS